jgi:hypothetical protein
MKKPPSRSEHPTPLASIAGTSPKVLSSLIGGRYVEYNPVDTIRQAACLDLLNQLEDYFARKLEEAAAGAKPVTRAQVVAAINRKKAEWGLTDAEVLWIAARIPTDCPQALGEATGSASIETPTGQMWASPSFPDTSNDMMCSGDRHDKNPKELHGRVQT